MPLNKLENFIKNAEGRILYVNPNDLDSTDGIENQGNSLTKPFKTIQRALIESARFSYLRGDDNDVTEKTTILVFPGEHLIDNRPGFGIKDQGNNAIAVAPGGAESGAIDTLTLTLNSNFDLTQEDNILYKFNSINGGIIIPRGTSIVGLDLRKTKVRPKYVPNPTDPNVPSSAIFRVTGACYFWQFTFFDGDETGLVYTDPRDFSVNNQSKPVFSHHKLTCFEYADGVNKNAGYDNLTDLDIYYAKVANAFNRASDREIEEKYPNDAGGFAKKRPEWEIVGAFASDPITISGIISGDGATPSTVVTVTTQTAHNLNSGTPIKIRGINVEDYNVSTKVVQVLNDRKFTYALESVRPTLPAGISAGLAPSQGAAVVIETDTVSGASPYIFNVSLRSVFGMAGMHADGSKADGFRSMVVAQFTAVSLQKDDRAFIKYNQSDRRWGGISSANTRVSGAELPAGASSLESSQIYHLDSDAVYREGWKTTHIKMSNDAVIQVVSVFAIGFHKHFECLSGGDASITNSNSNFGQFSLASDGFKKDAFDKDDKGFVTGVVTPRSIGSSPIEIEWVQFDADKMTGGTTSQQLIKSQRLYLLGYPLPDTAPPIISQGYRIGARVNEEVFLKETLANGTEVERSAKILMTNEIPTSASSNTCTGTDTSAKVYRDVVVSTVQDNNKKDQAIFTAPFAHNLKNGESIRVFSEQGDLPELLEEGKVYYAITDEKNSTGSGGRNDGVNLVGTQFQVATSITNANAATPISQLCYYSAGSELRVESRVSDKKAGEIGHPIQYDYVENNWFVYCEAPPSSDIQGTNHLYGFLRDSTGDSEISFIKRVEDGRSIDEKLYKMRYVVPKELENTRGPVAGFILQDSNNTGVRKNADFNKTTIATSADPANNVTANEYDFDRNPRFISSCTYSAGTPGTISIRTDRPHNLKVGDIVNIDKVPSSTNPNALENLGFNGRFNVKSISASNRYEFTTTNEDIFGVSHNPGTATFDRHQRDINLPRISRSDAQTNLYVYRVETVSEYLKDVQDGIYYLYVLNANNAIAKFDSDQIGDAKYSQNITDLYPQLDRDNDLDNPPAAVSFAKRTPIGEVVTNDLKRSITRESLDVFNKTHSYGIEISNASTTNTTATITLAEPHSLNSISGFNVIAGNNASHTEGTYYNVKLLNAANTNTWDGATADVVVDSSGNVTSATIVEGGCGYTDGETLKFDIADIGGNAYDAGVTINTASINSATDDYIQVTGIGTISDAYYRITSVPTITNNNQIGIARTNGDPAPRIGQYVSVVGRVASVSVAAPQGTVYTITSTKGHGLIAGNSIRILDSSNNNLGDFYVNNLDNTNPSTVFTVNSTTDISSGAYVLKHGMSANNASADSLGENIGTRLQTFYDNNVLFTRSGTTVSTSADQFRVVLPDGTNTTTRIQEKFPVGTYIQVNNEIMRVKGGVTGTQNDELPVIRGSMGTIIESHLENSLVKKIKLAPIELRRPSILRASAHTFEYLGYGPGNYSTGLPQVQVKTLSDDEEFLSQAQETACGTVLYTGMDSDGDFYIGNTKYSSQSGEQSVFDVPIPTITGEDPNRLSVVFDEVIVKERILVEGGKSKAILTQFDGPVTFTNTVRFNQLLTLNGVPYSLRTKGTVTIQSINEAVKCTGDLQAALRVYGGVSIQKNMYICDDIVITNGGIQVAGIGTFNGELRANSNAIIGGNATVGGTFGVQGTSTFNSDITVNGNINANGNIDLRDNDKLLIGDDDNLQIYHNGNNSVIADAGDGKLSLHTNDSEINFWNTTQSNWLLKAKGSGAVELYYAGTERFRTQSDGAKLIGNLEVTEDLQVNDNLTVNDNANFAGNSVSITNATVTANNFKGTADDALRVKVNDGTSGDQYPVMVNNVGSPQTLHRDTRLKFNGGTLTVSQDLVAFASDDRLKTNRVALTGALDKVCSLNGFTFNFNETGGELGFPTDVTYVGVSAQEVQEVLPEAVKPAGASDDYMTVQYEKIVPLLIEAIKELSDKVSALEDKLNN